MNIKLSVKIALIICQPIGKINMQELKEIQIKIKKELGGVSLNHLINYLGEEGRKNENKFFVHILTYESGSIQIKVEPANKIFFVGYYTIINLQNQALNIFGQSEEFQRNLYDAIQIIKNINNKSLKKIGLKKV